MNDVTMFFGTFARNQNLVRRRWLFVGRERSLLTQRILRAIPLEIFMNQGAEGGERGRGGITDFIRSEAGMHSGFGCRGRRI